MKFGAVPLAEASGGIVVHAIRTDGIVLKKGAVIGNAEIDALRAAGLREVTIARLEPGDVPENVAAAEIAAAAAGERVSVEHAFTGRANLFAEAAGVLVVSKAGVDRLNAIDPDITLATLSPFVPVVIGKMIATVKIIPFAVSAVARDRRSRFSKRRSK